MRIEPVTLCGSTIELQPLRPEHAEPLFATTRNPEVWSYLPSLQPNSPEEMADLIRSAANRPQSTGPDLPFAIVYRENGAIIGSTRFLDISENDRSLEIGWTFVSSDYWRTPVNTEAKYLLLQHAFETLQCIRVQLKTDLRNERSQRAIERIGGVREGIVRKMRILPDGYQRSSVLYSIIDDEWPAVRANLESKLGLTQA